MFDPCYQVKQYVAVVRSPTSGIRFQVFETGDPKFYLFDMLIGETSVSSMIQFPVRKSDLQTPVRRALAHGVGNSP